MGPITVSCGQFPLPPPRRLTGKAEIYSCGVTTPMGYCSLLLQVLAGCSPDESSKQERGLPCLWSACIAWKLVHL